MRKRLLRAFVLVFAMAAMACSHLPPAPEIATDAQVKTAGQWIHYPSSLRAQTRAVLTVRGRQYDMNGYVVARAPGDVRLRTYNDMGGTLFDVVAARGAEHVITNQIGLREKWLIEGALRDARMVFLASPSSGDATFTTARGEIVALSPAPGKKEHWFLRDRTGLPIGMLVVRGERVEWEAKFNGLAATPGWSGNIPQSINITDHRLGYTLHLQILDVQEAILEDDLFEEPRP